MATASPTTEGARTRRLAAGQEREWEVMCALMPTDPGRSRYASGSYVFLDGRLDRQLILDTFEETSERHDTLRLSLTSAAAEPEVRIASRPRECVELIDIADLRGRDQNVEIERIALQEKCRTFDLAGGPLWHARMVRLGPTQSLLTLTISHLIADGWARDILLGELMTGLRCRLGEGAALTDDPPSFDEICQMQRNRFAGDSERVSFWTARLAPRQFTTPFTPEPVPSADLLRTKRLPFAIDAATVVELRRCAWRARTTPFVALLAAYQLVLSLATRREQIVVSTTTVDRHNEREKKALSQYTADAYVAVSLAPDLTMLELVRTVHRALGDATRNLMSYRNFAMVINSRFATQRPWPDFYLCDGSFNAEVPSPRAPDRAAASVLTGRPVVIDAASAEDGAPDLTWNDLGAEERAAWSARSDPSFMINSARDGGVVRFNDHVFPEALVRGLIDAFLAVVRALAWEPSTKVDAVRRSYESTDTRLAPESVR